MIKKIKQFINFLQGRRAWNIRMSDPLNVTILYHDNPKGKKKEAS